MKKILTIDGGGVRGIIPAKIIAHIEALCKTRYPDEIISIPKLFDLISGTSAGGILCALYSVPSDQEGLPKYSAQKALEIYTELAPRLFSKSFSQIILSGMGLFKSRYGHKLLEEKAFKYFGDTYISEALCDILITSYDMTNRKALLFSKYSAMKYGSMGNYRFRDIARATSAAPTYFTPAAIYAQDGGFRHLVDGGVYANNPSMCSYVESSKLWPNSSPKDLLMLSIGTGKVEKPYFYRDTKRFGYAKWLVPIIDILMSSVSETVDYQAMQLFHNAGFGDNYIRIEPVITGCDTRMDNGSKKNMEALLASAQRFIDHNGILFDDIITIFAKNY